MGWKTTIATAVLVMVPIGAVRAQVPFGLVLADQSRAGFTLEGSGARPAGMGGAFTALADDASAASFNPAGLAQLLVPEVSVVWRWSGVDDAYRGFTSFDQVPPLPLTDSTLSSSGNGLNFASVTLPFRWGERRWAFQVSTQEVVDFTYRGSRSFLETDPAGSPLFRLDQKVDQGGDISVLTASVAVRLTERTLLGVSVNRWEGDWSFAARYAEAQLEEGGEEEYFQFSQDNDLKGWNADLGLLLVYPWFNVGIRYRLPFEATYRYREELETNLPSELQPVNGDTTLRWPGTLQVGVAFKPSDRLVLALDYGRTDWGRFRFHPPGTPGDVNFFDLREPGQSGARVAEDLRIGMEYLFFAGRTVIPVRAGVFREPWPVEDVVTGDRLVRSGLALGIGFKHGSVAVDLAWQRGEGNVEVVRFLEPAEIAAGRLEATSRGRLERTDDRFLLSVIVQFPRGSGPERAFHEIFVGPVEQ